MNDYHQTWDPLIPTELQQLFKHLKISWWIAGGWALDLFAGYQTRVHADIDVVILRRDQLVLQNYLANWDLQACDPPGSHRLWMKGEFLKPGINDVWCRPSSTSMWSFQLMLMDEEGGFWIFRRDTRIKGLISSLGLVDAKGIPFLRPEIQLLFKATGSLREKDNIDFTQIMLLLDQNAKDWLRDQLMLLCPQGHAWLYLLNKKVAE